MPIEEPLYSWLLLIGRCCLAAVFLVSGIHKSLCYQAAAREFHNAAVPFTSVLLPMTIALHIAASLAMIGGILVMQAALALALFTVVATLKVHCFWRMSGAERLDRSRIALANLAVVGGLLLLAAIGPGQLRP